jgi:hypothetical protein
LAAETRNMGTLTEAVSQCKLCTQADFDHTKECPK